MTLPQRNTVCADFSFFLCFVRLLLVAVLEFLGFDLPSDENSCSVSSGNNSSSTLYNITRQKLPPLFCNLGSSNSTAVFTVATPSDFLKSFNDSKCSYLQRSHWDKLRTVFLFLIAIKVKKLWQFQFVNFRPIFGFLPLFRATICRSRRRNRRDHQNHLFYCHFLIFHPILMKFGTLTEKVLFFSFLVKYSVYLYCNT